MFASYFDDTIERIWGWSMSGNMIDENWQSMVADMKSVVEWEQDTHIVLWQAGLAEQKKTRASSPRGGVSAVSSMAANWV